MRNVLAALIVIALCPGVAARAADEAWVREAILREVQARLGQDADVRIASLDLSMASNHAQGPLKVTPEPAARVGRASVFSLTVLAAAGPRRIGSAVAVVEATAPGIRLARDVEHGETLTRDDVVLARGDVNGAPLAALPRLEDVDGARVRRDLPRGTLLTSKVVAPVPLVRSGQQVVLTVRIGRAVVTGMGVATENGQAGEIVRVVNPDSRRTIEGRVVAPGEVEVIHGS